MDTAAVERQARTPAGGARAARPATRGGSLVARGPRPLPRELRDARGPEPSGAAGVLAPQVGKGHLRRPPHPGSDAGTGGTTDLGVSTDAVPGSEPRGASGCRLHDTGGSRGGGGATSGESGPSCGAGGGRPGLPLPQPPRRISCSRPRGGGAAFRPARQRRVKAPPSRLLNIHERRGLPGRLRPHIPNASPTVSFYSKGAQGVRIRDRARPDSYWSARRVLFAYAM